MPYEDFLRHFTNLVVCRMPNKALVSLQRTWHENLFLTEWKFDSNRVYNRAGGCINNKDTFLLNPQVHSSVNFHLLDFPYFPKKCSYLNPFPICITVWTSLTKWYHCPKSLLLKLCSRLPTFSKHSTLYHLAMWESECIDSLYSHFTVQINISLICMALVS